MNKFKTLALVLATLGAAAAQAASVMDQPPAGGVEPAAAAPLQADLDRIVAVVNNEVITETELQQRVHTVAINLRRAQIELPPMEQLRQQVLERLITERAIMQRAVRPGSASTTKW